METKVIKCTDSELDLAGIDLAATTIDAGGLVAFPTETVYGIACRAKNDSIVKLDNIKGRTPDKFYTLHLAEDSDVDKYVPTIKLNTRKLIKNAWPGPLTVVFELNTEDIYKQKGFLEKEVFENLYNNNSIGIRCPDNPIASELLQRTKYPVLAPSANLTGQTPAVNTAEVLAQLSGKINILLDGGQCKYKKSSTVIKIDNRRFKVLRPGVYSQVELEAISEVKFLFVCTGNTCRSPMAEGIFKKYLAQKLHCKVDELEQMGYKVISAGIMGTNGFPASTEAVKACDALGVDIAAHRNRGLSRELIEQSDFIFAMEKMHRNTIISLDPDAAKRCFLLAGNKQISDPIGLQQKHYNDCARIIEKAAKRIISEITI